MNILIVEDESDFVEEIKSRINELCREPVYTVAGSFQEASINIDTKFFDMIFLDLKIPSVTGGMDSDPQNGRNLLDVAIASAPGTPVFMLTGSSAEQFLPEMMELSNQVDIWGQRRPLPLIGFHQKHRFDAIDEKILPYMQAFESACEVELNSSCDICIPTSRLIRIFTSSVGGVFCKVDRIGGGLSSASVYKLSVNDGGGGRIYNSIAKIGFSSCIQDEVDRHDRFISRLEPNATPRKIAVLAHGAKKTSGVFYSLASASDLNGFSFMNDEASLIIERIKNCLQPWIHPATQRRMTVGDIRRTFIDDASFESVTHLISHQWVKTFESNPIQVNWGCVHGDLHGLNVLVSPDRVPVLIDYGDVGEGALSSDPITFELSVFFHPDGPLKSSEWPSDEVAGSWGQREFIDEQCPSNAFFNSCQQWAVDVSVGKRERAAVAYGYLVRQLKYADCNIVRVNALLAGIKNLYHAA